MGRGGSARRLCGAALVGRGGSAPWPRLCGAAPILALAGVLLLPAPALADGRGLALLMAGPACPEPAVVAQLEAGLGKSATARVSPARVAAALARVRAARALQQARELYTRTNFAGCVALLSITEQELGRNLADPDAALLSRAHTLLAQINLWLGTCQWAAGDPQTAASPVVRAAQLPANPAPDPKLLPPELIEAHRGALSAPRQDVSCELAPPLRAEDLLVDGRIPDLDGDRFRVAAGTHYLTLQARCTPGLPACDGLRRALGGEGMRSLRLEASPLRCRVAVPSVRGATAVACASLSEARELAFVRQLTEETRGEGTLAVALSRGRVALRLHRSGGTSFARQVMTQLEAGERAERVVARSLGLLLGAEPPEPPKRTEEWYKRWWVWALVGATVIATTTTAVAVSRAERSHEYHLIVRP